MDASGKPNIIVITGDDVGWENIGAYHQGLMYNTAPNLDKLAGEGMRFTDYYAEPSCTAGRANFITGEFPSCATALNGVAASPRAVAAVVAKRLSIRPIFMANSNRRRPFGQASPRTLASIRPWCLPPLFRLQASAVVGTTAICATLTFRRRAGKVRNPPNRDVQRDRQCPLHVVESGHFDGAKKAPDSTLQWSGGTRNFHSILFSSQLIGPPTKSFRESPFSSQDFRQIRHVP
jgi:hypothetical protein